MRLHTVQLLTRSVRLSVPGFVSLFQQSVSIGLESSEHSCGFLFPGETFRHEKPYFPDDCVRCKVNHHYVGGYYGAASEEEMKRELVACLNLHNGVVQWLGVAF